MALEQHACGVVLGLAPSGRRYDSLDRRLSEWDQAQMVQTDRHACSERLVPRYSITAILDQLLYQLGARSLVLDQHDIRSKQALLLTHRALECGIFEAPGACRRRSLPGDGRQAARTAARYRSPGIRRELVE